MLNLTPAPRETVGAMCGLSHLSGPFRAAAKRLREVGFLTEDTPGALALTAAGRTRGVAAAAPKTLREFHARWLSRWPARTADILRAVIAVRGPIDRKRLAEQVGISEQSGPFRSAVKDLQTAGVVIYPGPQVVQASDLLFPKGLR